MCWNSNNRSTVVTIVGTTFWLQMGDPLVSFCNYGPTSQQMQGGIEHEGKESTSRGRGSSKKGLCKTVRYQACGGVARRRVLVRHLHQRILRLLVPRLSYWAGPPPAL